MMFSPINGVSCTRAIHFLGCCALLLVVSFTGLAQATSPAEWQTLNRGQVVVKENIPTAKGSVPSVEAQILIAKPVEKVWPVVADPEKLLREEKKVKSAKVVSRSGNQQNVAFKVIMTPLFPPFSYVLLQKLSAPTLITFTRVSGSFKDVDGAWKLSAVENGTKTILSYTLKLDPGPLVPRSLLLAAVKSDLPNFMRNVKLSIDKAN